jgi:hypothetical protein
MADALGQPLLLVSAHGALLHANQAAHSLLKQGDWLALEHGRLRLAGDDIGSARLLGALAAGLASGQRKTIPLRDETGQARPLLLVGLDPDDAGESAVLVLPASLSTTAGDTPQGE